MKRNNARQRGFTLVEIMIVVAIIGMLASIAIPNYVRSRYAAHKAACLVNLSQIEGAVQMWATETRKGPTTTVEFSDINGYLQRSVVCPAGGTTFGDSYQLSTVEAMPVCLRVTSGQYAHIRQL
jgi:prepilin-type N-terminal cleavage/methylation domain-containing protein